MSADHARLGRHKRDTYASNLAGMTRANDEKRRQLASLRAALALVERQNRDLARVIEQLERRIAELRSGPAQ